MSQTINASDQIRMIKQAFEEVACAKGKAKQPLVEAMEERASGRALLILLDDSIVLHIGRKALAKPIDLPANHQFSSLFAVCDYLSAKSGVTDQDIADVQHFIRSLDTDVQEFAAEFIQKTLRLGVTMKTVQKVFKSVGEPQMGCMLAKKFFEHPHAIDGKSFALTEKLDGFRCLALCEPGEMPVLLSRQGKRIEGLVDIERELAHVCEEAGEGFMVDGELLIENREDIPSKEQYKRTSRIVSSKQNVKTGVVYNVFDYVMKKRRAEGDPYWSRRIALEEAFVDCPHVKPVPTLYIGTDEAKIWEHLDQQRALNHEGVMINLMDAPYVYGRTTNLLKVKVMQDADLRVIGVKEGVGRFAGTTGALVVDWKGTPVGVGSGLTQAMRDTIWSDPDRVIGRIAKVRYFEETVSKENVPSIRFPVFECFREAGKDVSYE